MDCEYQRKGNRKDAPVLRRTKITKLCNLKSAVASPGSHSMLDKTKIDNRASIVKPILRAKHCWTRNELSGLRRGPLRTARNMHSPLCRPVELERKPLRKVQREQGRRDEEPTPDERSPLCERGRIDGPVVARKPCAAKTRPSARYWRSARRCHWAGRALPQRSRPDRPARCHTPRRVEPERDVGFLKTRGAGAKSRPGRGKASAPRKGGRKGERASQRRMEPDGQVGKFAYL